MEQITKMKIHKSIDAAKKHATRVANGSVFAWRTHTINCFDTLRLKVYLISEEPVFSWTVDARAKGHERVQYYCTASPEIMALR